jgi:CBS domain-containing protein
VAAPDRPTTTVGAIAAPLTQVPVAAPEDRLLTLLPRLAESELGRAIVLDGVHLAGIVSLTDVTRALEIRGLADPVTS